MENKHSDFIKIYQAERSPKEKKRLLKTYMLSLSSDDLDSFIFHNLDKLHTYIVDSEEKNTLTESDKQELLSSLSDLELTLASKSKRPKAA